MKNFLTICIPIFMVIFTIGNVKADTHVKRYFNSTTYTYDDCYVLSPKSSFAELFPWTNASSSLAACPGDFTFNLLPGECSAVATFDFNCAPLINPPSDVTLCQSNSTNVESTIYCPYGQTRYKRSYTHTGPTDLTLHNVTLGVYESSNSPDVVINIYDGTNTLLSSTTQTISDFTAPGGLFDYDLNDTHISVGSTYYVEVVADAPLVSIFKIGRNTNGGTEAVITSPSCVAMNVEGIVNANAVVFCPVGTLDDYKINNLSGNGYESGDAFPVGETDMHYSVSNANGNIILDCEFSVTVNGYQPASNVISCNNLVQVSLDDDCNTIVTPEMLLQGGLYGCYGQYTVSIAALNGTNLGNVVTSAQLGQTLTTTITGPNGNSCWGKILVQDKFGPNLVCEDVYTTCSSSLTPGSFINARVPVSAYIKDGAIDIDEASENTFKVSVKNLNGATVNDLNVFLDISHTNVSDLAATLTSPSGTTTTLFISPGGGVDCDEDNIMVTLDDESNNTYNDLFNTCDLMDPTITGNYQPRDLLNEFDGEELEGDWIVTIYDLNDGDGGNVNHIDLIFEQDGAIIPFPTPNPVTFNHVADNIYIVNGVDLCGPSTLSYTDEIIEEDCSSIYSRVIKRCWKGYDAKNNPANECCQFIYIYRNGLSTLEFPPNFDGLNGNPQPLSCTIFGDSIPPTSVTGVPIGDLCYNVQMVAPVDITIAICEHSYKIIRTHKVIEWCSGQVIVHNQIIKILDNQGPILKCPKDATISSDEYACTATYVVPRPEANDQGCSDNLIYHLSYNPTSNAQGDYFTTNVNQATNTISGLPEGENWIKWTVTDECGNSTDCYYKITVKDLILPNPVCDRTTVASLSGNGEALIEAFTFDDGSLDNCGILRYEARKRQGSLCFSTDFGPSVKFCCDEVNTTIMVEFRVTDLSGNSNTCMVEVKVQDKLPPYITKCAPDITLDCQSDYKDLTVTKQPEYVDNCSAILLPYKDSVNINNCGVGRVTRLWTVEDKQGLRHSCVQVITLQNYDPFYYNIYDENDPKNDIKWPNNYSTPLCHSNLEPMNLPAGYQKPIFLDDNCSLVAAHYKDQVFVLIDGACEKIIRTWTVIDWCTYNDQHPIYGVGWYEHVQIIKIANEIPPTFNQGACVDRTIASYGNCEGLVDFTMGATDDCPENTTALAWKYELDIDNNGTIDDIVTSNRINRIIKDGKHKIKWTVEDKCGNRAYCTQFITVVDAKKPSPYCLSSITTAVMNSLDKSISIWAKDYDKGAFDNCTAKEDLWFTFFGAKPVTLPTDLTAQKHYFKGNGILATQAEYNAGTAQVWIPETKTSGIVFDCGDIPNGKSQEVTVEIWVTDKAGNQDYCSVVLILQDNANVCPDVTGNMIAITGRVALPGGSGKSNVNVNLSSNVSEQNKDIITDANGNYSFSNLPINTNYTVSMHDNTNVINGVSTLDLVLIQRHILGIALLDDPKKMIAADVDNSTKITASDLVSLRKNILGITSEFPNNQKSWRFLTANHVFTSVSNPFPFTEKYVYNQLSDNKVNQNFIPIKIGDINGSAIYNANTPLAESRSSKTMTLEMDKTIATAGQEITVPIMAYGFENVFGYQFTFEFDHTKVALIDIDGQEIQLTESNFGMHKSSEGIVTTSWNTDQPTTVEDGNILMTLKFKALSNIDGQELIKISSAITPISAYDSDLNIMNVQTRYRNASVGEFTLLQNNPNPFQDQTVIGFTLPESGAIKLRISDITGKVVKVITGEYTKGSHNITLDKGQLGITGVLIYQLDFGKYSETKKMVIVE